jgi:hypothetical protein
MHRKTIIATMLLTAVAASTLCVESEPLLAQQDAEGVQQWVAQLDSGQFATRQQASRRLRDAGLAAIKPLVAAADGRQSEVTRRAVDVLDSLCESDDGEVAQAARDALERLARSSHRLPAYRASVVLRGQRLRQQRAALAEIQRLGGTVSAASVEDGELVISQLVLGRKWEAGDEGLRYLVKLGRIESLKLYGSQFTDDGLEYLTKLTSVQWLRLYATQITDGGQQRLKENLPGTLVDRRHGALLGVSGAGDAKGCRLSMVREGSAAHRAGLQIDDVITNVDNTPIPDLATLIATIARQRPGDRIKVTFLRDDQTLELDVVLGELGEESD